MTKANLTVQEQFGVSIGEVSRAWRYKLNKRLKPLGMSQMKWSALLLISRADRIMQSDLAALMGVEAPAATRLIKQLEDEGYITRHALASDARVKLLRVTPQARKVISRINAEVNRLRAETVSQLKESEAAAGLRALRTLQQLLKEL